MGGDSTTFGYVATGGLPRQSLDIISGEVVGEDQVGGCDEEEAAAFLVVCPTRVGGWLAGFDDSSVS